MAEVNIINLNRAAHTLNDGYVICGGFIIGWELLLFIYFPIVFVRLNWNFVYKTYREKVRK